MALNEDEFYRQARERFAAKVRSGEVKPPKPAAPAASRTRTTRPAPKRLETVRLADVAARDVDWLWEPYLPLGMLAMLDGDPEAGKTLLACDLIARLTSGRPMPFADTPTDPAAALILCPEDALPETLRPRLEAAGADLVRTHVVAATWSAHAVELLDELLGRLPSVRLVYIDALMSAIGQTGEDAHRDADVRAILDPLADLAERRGVAILCGRHLAKREHAKAIYAGGGSIAFGARVRSGLLVATDPDAPDGGRVLAHVKANVGRRGQSLRWRIATRPVEGLRSELPTVAWVGRSSRTANDVVSWSPERDARGGARMGATSWLAAYLADRREAPVQELLAAAREDGIEVGRDTWKRVREDLGVIVRGGGSATRWVRPEAAAPELDVDDPMRP